MKDRLIELLEKTFAEQYEKRGLLTAPHTADYLLANGVIVPPCKVGQTVYVIEPLWYGIWGENEHKCRKCEHFYEGGMGDNPDCTLGKNCCYHIVEEEADLRSLADWITPNRFTKEIAWGKTVFLTREEAEQALKERENE